MASSRVDLARGEIWKKSLEASRARRAAAAIARRRRLRFRGSSGSALAVALLTGVLGAGMAIGHEASERPAKRASAGVLEVGSSGPAVSALQRKLGRIAVDGIFGRQTRAAVVRYQRSRGLAVDGIAGPQTLGALGLSAGGGGGDGDGNGDAEQAPASGGEPQSREESGGGDGSVRERTGGGSDVSGELRRIAQCESGGNPRAVSRDGRYRGKYQFDRATWRAVGGRGDPADAPEAEQDRRAQQLYERSGSAPWSNCA